MLTTLAASRSRLAEIVRSAQQLDQVLVDVEASSAEGDGPLSTVGVARLLLDLDSIANRLLGVAAKVAEELDPSLLAVEE